MIKLRVMRSTGHVAQRGAVNKIFVGKTEGKRPHYDLDEQLVGGT
jgi:hypothetical protein